MRTESSIKNLLFAFGGQIVGILISLLSRLVFVRILTSEYLGLSGLFSNILSMLTLAELGVGTAITYNLYKPLAEKDNEKIKSLMQLYKIAYRVIGIIIFVIGVLLTPLLPHLINDMPNIPNINLIYILFVANSSISYFYSYKRVLITSDQKKYIATVYRYTFYFLLNVSQIIGLLITRNYIVFLVLQIIMTLLENIMVSRKADKMYPYLKEKNVNKLDKITKKSIAKNVSAMTLHKIGGVVVNSTDNLIISKYVGLNEVGIYSNYYLITNSITIILSQVFSSITAGIGNLAAVETEDKVYDVFKKVFFLNFWIFSFAAIGLFILFNDFISLWLGKEYIFDVLTVICIVMSFYITGMRKTVLTYKDALGLYWQDRYKPIIESVINIVVSILLVKKFNVAGVFMGTIISTITTCFWIEPYVLYKYALKQKLSKYLKQYGIYTIVGLIALFITYIICKLFKEVTIINFIIKLIICLIIPNLFYCLIFKNKNEFKYYIKLIKKIMSNIKLKIFKQKNKCI